MTISFLGKSKSGKSNDKHVDDLDLSPLKLIVAVPVPTDFDSASVAVLLYEGTAS